MVIRPGVTAGVKKPGSCTSQTCLRKEVCGTPSDVVTKGMLHCFREVRCQLSDTPGI